jgi:hypothetical protein
LVCLCISHHDLHHEGKLEIAGSAPRLTFRRIVDDGDRVEELGDYELVDVWTIEESAPHVSVSDGLSRHDIAPVENESSTIAW